MSDLPTPLITIIIATYNKSDVLYYAIKSVLWQTLTDFDCWIVGDACTDDSESVVASFEDPRLNWFNLAENSGYQSEPNNEGLRRAKGKYIAYLNHDDLWLPNHLQVLVDNIERTQADFVYSIAELITAYGQFPDIPDYPDAPRPPEASATLHRRDVVDKIGYWKAPHEVRAIPRVDFFRQAQFAGMVFDIAPYLTVLKFGRTEAGYKDSSLQEKYMERICEDPDFVAKELAEMLVKANQKAEGPLSLTQLRIQMAQSMRLLLVKSGIDPGILKPWLKPGDRIKNWRRAQGPEPK